MPSTAIITIGFTNSSRQLYINAHRRLLQLSNVMTSYVYEHTTYNFIITIEYREALYANNYSEVNNKCMLSV
jgi:hypothetical protein